MFFLTSSSSSSYSGIGDLKVVVVVRGLRVGVGVGLGAGLVGPTVSSGAAGQIGQHSPAGMYGLWTKIDY